MMGLRDIWLRSLAVGDGMKGPAAPIVSAGGPTL
jgi:hypothetical protein